MSSLFKEVSGGRPEHVAKGALVYLLRRDIGLVSWIAAQCNRVVGSATNIAVMAEVPEGEHGWRADVVIELPDAKPLTLELKLGAPFTVNQRNALAAGEIDLVIAPHPSVSSMVPNTTRVALWKDLLAQVASSDRGAAAALLLLQEAAESYGWYLELISPEDIRADAAAMFDNQTVSGRRERDWSQSYRFLNQLDTHLEALKPAEWLYAPSASRRIPNRKYSHYGYYFMLGPAGRKARPDEWWVGFNREDAKLAFRLYMNETELKHEWSVDSDLHATAVVNETLATVTQQLAATHGD